MRLPIKTTPFAKCLALDHYLIPTVVKSNHLKRLARNYAFGGARTGDFWLMAAGLLMWRWVARRQRRRG